MRESCTHATTKPVQTERKGSERKEGKRHGQDVRHLKQLKRERKQNGLNIFEHIYLQLSLSLHSTNTLNIGENKGNNTFHRIRFTTKDMLCLESVSDWACVSIS